MMVDSATFCSWCRAARWRYKCSTCDPRKEKTFCTDCSTLWHSRGYARNHQLTSSYGETRSYHAWGALEVQDGVGSSNGTSGNNSAVETDANLAVNGVSDVANGVEAMNGAEDVAMPAATVQKEEEKPTEEAKPEVTAQGDAGNLNGKKQEEEGKEDESMEEEFAFETVGESVDSKEDGDTASVENNDEPEEKTKEVTSVEAPRAAKSAEVSNSATESTKGQQDESIASQASKQEDPIPANTASTPVVPLIPETPDATSKPTANSSIPATVAVPAVSNTSTLAPAPSPATAPVNAEVPSSSSSPAAPASAAAVTPASNPAVRDSANATSVAQPNADNTPTPGRKQASTPQSKPVDLDKLLRWFPATDRVLMDMLAARIQSALVIEDALICARIGKCEDPVCRSVLLHYEHCKRDELCHNPKCMEISVVYKHRRACLKKDTPATVDAKTFVCPFCIRIRQRRSLGVSAALDYLINDQRRALHGAHSEAQRNFCLQSIETWTQRKRILRAETDRLNQQASESSLPIFNFPRYQWHFSDNVFIKREPTEEATAEQPAIEASTDDNNRVQATEQPSAGHEERENRSTPDDNADTKPTQDTQDGSIPGSANFNVDFINQLLQAKSESGEGSEVAHREFDGVMELGYAIVDASFCAPSKTQKCLLNCKSILDHLQHHLDLQVCTQVMCTAVEHHFGHLSQCKATGESESCEYCLRVEERQVVRSVDYTEAELPEAEAKVQKIINDITASFTNHRPDEREQEVIQLEDELDQAEANKQELLEKLSTARLNLREVRRNMEHRGVSTSVNHRLPVHFSKVRRSDGSGGNFKKRRLHDQP